jgi:hypothetical protein
MLAFHYFVVNYTILIGCCGCSDYFCRITKSIKTEMERQIIGPGDMNKDCEIFELQDVMRQMIESNTKFKDRYTMEQVRM